MRRTLFNIEGQSINKSSVKSYISRHSGSPEIVVLLLRLSGTASIIAPCLEIFRRKIRKYPIMLPTYFYSIIRPKTYFGKYFSTKIFQIFSARLYNRLSAQKRIEKACHIYPRFFKTAYHILRFGCLELIAGIVSLKSRKKAFVSDGRAQSIE